MAWSVPLTAISNATLTAAQWNASVRDNLLETAVAKATAAGRYYVSTAANALAERVPSANSVNTSETTTSTTYAALTTPGPAVTVTTGAACLIAIGAKIQNNTNTATSLSSYAVSGATTVAASDNQAVGMAFTTAASTTLHGSKVTLHNGLTAGSNTFTMQYRVSAGTGSYDMRHILAIPF